MLDVREGCKRLVIVAWIFWALFAGLFLCGTFLGFVVGGILPRPR